MFFAKVCKEACDHYGSTTGKGKVPARGSADKHSDCEINERVGVMSDSDSDDSDGGTNGTTQRGICTANANLESANEDNNEIVPGGIDVDEHDGMYASDSYEGELGEDGDGQYGEGSETDS